MNPILRACGVVAYMFLTLADKKSKTTHFLKKHFLLNYYMLSFGTPPNRVENLRNFPMWAQLVLFLDVYYIDASIKEILDIINL